MKIEGTGTEIHPVKSMFGLLMCAFGIYLLAITFGKPLEDAIVHVIVFWFGVFIAGFGLALAFYVNTFDFDENEKILTFSHGIILGFASKKYAFSSIERIEGRKHVSSESKDAYGNVTNVTYCYQGYIVLPDHSFEIVYSVDEAEFRNTIEKIRQILNVPVSLRIQKVVPGEPHEPRIGILRIFLLMLCVSFVSWGLLKYVWPLQI